MEQRTRSRTRGRSLAVALCAAAIIGLSGCGGSADQAGTLLHQTFSGRHRVNSGKLAVVLSVTPAAPSGLKGPLTLSLAGPFQSLGPNTIPASSFNVSLSTSTGAIAATITSTGSTGYVTFQGQSYQLPHATFQRLESSFVRLGAVSEGTGNGGTLGRLGIHPERWLVNPQIVGDEAISGTNTTRIRAGINMNALLGDVGTFLQRAASAGASAARNLLPPASRRQIASEVRNAVVNVWTGVADKTLRQLEVDLTVPVSGQLSLLFGRSAGIRLMMGYANLNQPQTITAPARLLPYSQFQDKLRVLITDFESQVLSGGAGGG